MHIWLGWIVGLPILLWIVSGLVMVWKPIEQVRGEDLLRDPPPLAASQTLARPPIGLRPIRSISLQHGPHGAVWLIRYADGAERTADAATGRFLPPLDAAAATQLVLGRYTGRASLLSVTSVPAERPPLELRKKVDAWQIAMSDGTHFYVAKSTGEIVARRTRWWRFYDLMWGLHIMDLRTREDTSNPLVIGFALVSLLTVLLALALLPLATRFRRKVR